MIALLPTDVRVREPWIASIMAVVAIGLLAFDIQFPRGQTTAMLYTLVVGNGPRRRSTV